MSIPPVHLFPVLAILLFSAWQRPAVRVDKLEPVGLNVRSHLPQSGADSPRLRDAAGTSPLSGMKFMRRGSLPAIVRRVQSKNPDDLAAGKLLVASRDIADPLFAKTVVLLVQYDSESVVGLMVNKRTHVPLSRVFKDLKAAKDRSDLAYAGGPVDLATVFALLRSTSKPDAAQQIFAGVYLISTRSQLEAKLSTPPDPGVFHVYLGYAGWTPEQLRQEIRLGAWFIFQPDTEAVFNSNPDSLWSQMIRRTELKLAAVDLHKFHN